MDPDRTRAMLYFFADFAAQGGDPATALKIRGIAASAPDDELSRIGEDIVAQTKDWNLGS